MTSLMQTKSRNILDSTDHAEYDATIGLAFSHTEIILCHPIYAVIEIIFYDII